MARALLPTHISAMEEHGGLLLLREAPQVATILLKLVIGDEPEVGPLIQLQLLKLCMCHSKITHSS